jgi:hypothetical protein
VELSSPFFTAPIGGEVVRVVLESLTGAGWKELGSQFASVSEGFLNRYPSTRRANGREAQFARQPSAPERPRSPRRNGS